MLSKDQIEKIDFQTWDVLLDAYQGKEIIPPININKVIEKSGLTLKVGHFKDFDTAGAFDRAARVIYVERNAPYVRQVFTVAHELGHYYLHRDKAVEVFYQKNMPENNGNSSIEELEANWFAASLLMPKDLLSLIWSATKDITEVARRFSVTSATAYYRLKILGYLD